MDSLTITTDEHGTIENPALQIGLQIRRSWGAYMERRGERVAPSRDALLHRNESGRFDVLSVPVGTYLGFGAEVQSQNRAWEKMRKLYLVLHRDATSITLREVGESEIRENTQPTLIRLADDINRVAAQVQNLQAAVQRLLDQRQRP